jgi:hypothetical protein
VELTEQAEKGMPLEATSFSFIVYCIWMMLKEFPAKGNLTCPSTPQWTHFCHSAFMPVSVTIIAFQNPIAMADNLGLTKVFYLSPEIRMAIYRLEPLNASTSAILRTRR